MQYVDTSTQSYKIASEAFGMMALDQQPKDRYGYKKMALESVTTSDSGMVLDRLYKSLMGRSSINFGKIPESMGDLSKFSRYRSMSETLSLLHRSLDEYNIPELQITQELHDYIIRCRDDFLYGFKVDSQFLKTTYNTMVYSLCEMINLCTVIYVDMLKFSSAGKPFTYNGYQDLLLVQNCKKFIDMVKSGEWAQMMSGIRKDARNLMDFIFAPSDDGNSMAHNLAGLKAPVGIFGIWATASSKNIKTATQSRISSVLATKPSDFPKTNPEEYAKLTKVTVKDVANGMKGFVTNMKKSLPGKVVVWVMAIVAGLFILRTIIFLFYRGIYSLRDILDDSEKFLRFHMDQSIADPSGTSKSFEKQRKLYDSLSGLRDKIEEKILKSDAQARKDLKEANSTEFSPKAYQNDAADISSGADFSIG